MGYKIFNKTSFYVIIILVVSLSCGYFINDFINEVIPLAPFIKREVSAEDFRFDEEAATIMAIKKVTPAVVSIVVTDTDETLVINLGTGTKSTKKEKKEKGSGTGFLISADGLILTNKHVVNAGNEKTAEYLVLLSSGKRYFAQFIGKDPINDLAVLKIFDKNLPYVNLGDSDKIEIGKTVIAIGNTLGRYQNSVTKGIVSGLGRKITASDQIGNFESLDNVIQTDAEINPGNSGGPLIDLAGNVIGINVAIDKEGSSIGFSIPINDAKTVIKTVREIGRIVRPRLGVRYVMITPEVVEEKKLKINDGALITSGDKQLPSVLSDSPAKKADLQENDIILEVNGIKLNAKNTLLSVVQKYKPKDKLGFKIQRGDRVMIKTVELDEFKN